MEPITTILVAGVMLGLKDTAAQAVKDAYAALKQAAGSGYAALKDALGDAEKRKDNKALVQGLIEDALKRDSAALGDKPFLDAVESLRKALSEQTAQRKTTGVKLDEIEESVVLIGAVDAHGGASGIEATRIKNSELHIGTVKAYGDPSGNE